MSEIKNDPMAARITETHNPALVGTHESTMSFVASQAGVGDPTSSAFFHVLGGSDQGKTFLLAELPVSIGTDVACTICLTDKFVSRKHAEVLLSPQGYVVRDLGSRNGTIIAGCRVSEALVTPGSVIKLGGTTLRLEVQGVDGPSPASESTPAAVIGQHTAETIHEIKNLLMGVKASADVLARFEDAALPAAAIIRGMDSMSRCVSKILNFARSEQFSPETCQLAALVADTLLFWAPALQAHGIRLERSTSPDLPVWGDPRQLRELLSNLIENAIQGMLGGGTLRVSARREDSGVVVVRVADSGAGVPEEIRTRIFEPFFTTRSSGQGMGLGLAICRRIAVAHGGNISCAGAAGGGAEFTVLLPKVTA